MLQNGFELTTFLFHSKLKINFGTLATLLSTLLASFTVNIANSIPIRVTRVTKISKLRMRCMKICTTFFFASADAVLHNAPHTRVL